jgi:large subunit ribosomal protein L5
MAQEVQSIMKKISLQKVVLNMGVGKSGDDIEIAKKALHQISGKKSSSRNAKATERDWGVRKGEPIGVAVTVRGNDAKELLKRLFEAKGNQVKGKSFDNFGNYSFGIKEHIDIPGVKYDPQIGILGLDVSVSLSRPGFNIRVRSKHKARLGKSHKITKKDAQDFFVNGYGVEVE